MLKLSDSHSIVESEGQKEDSTGSQLIKSIEDMSIALEKIAQETIIALDMEGKDLGRDGVISIISIATPHNVYIFDIIEMEVNFFQAGLENILSSDKWKKLMFDCRRDADALFAHHNIRLDGVYDLQLLEIMKRDENSEESLTRLYGCLHRGNINGNPSLYENVKRLEGLTSLINLYNGLDCSEGIKKKVRNSYKSNPNYWLARPLSSDAITYAKEDVQC
jgi:hypothetical protein